MTIILDEYLTIGLIDLATPNCFTRSLTPLYTVRRVGSNRWIPNVGARAYRKKSGEVSVSIDVLIRGQFQEDGSASADPFVGFDTTLRAMEAEFLDDADVTLAAVWHRPVANREADVQIDGFELTDRTGFEGVCTLDVVVPQRWTDVTP